MHLDHVLYRLQDLVFQAQCATIPEEALLPAEVLQGHAVARARDAIDPYAELQAIVTEGELRRVATGAALCVVAAQPFFIEQETAQLHTFNRHRVVRRDRHGRHVRRDRQRVGCGLERSARHFFLLIGATGHQQRGACQGAEHELKVALLHGT